MFSKLRQVAGPLIAKNRRSRPVRAAYRLARFVEDSYHNADLDFATNGERRIIRALASADFWMGFDVGAHVGDWSIEALHAWPRARVHAFEVAAPTLDRLERRLDDAGLASRVVLNRCGLSDRTGSECMYYFPEHPELTCDRPRHDGREFITFEAQLARGDDYVADHGIGSIDFLKTDVEGAEYRVLRGLERSLAAGRIHCIQFEYGAFSIQTRVLLADYYEMLAPGYWVGKIYPSYVDFRDYNWTVESFQFANFLAVSRERPDLKRLLEG